MGMSVCRLGSYLLCFCFVFCCFNTEARADVESRYEACAANVRLDEVTAWLEEAGAPYADKLWALMCAESTGKLDALRADTNVYGAWQMSGATLRRYGCSPLNSTLEEQTICAAQYLRHLHDDMRMLSFEELIHAWALGGHNFERRGRTGTKMSKDLVWTVKQMLRISASNEAEIKQHASPNI